MSKPPGFVSHGCQGGKKVIYIIFTEIVNVSHRAEERCLLVIEFVCESVCVCVFGKGVKYIASFTIEC